MSEPAIEAEVVAISPVERTLFAAKNGAELVHQATEYATALADVVRKQGLSVKISNREHVKVEGWTLLGSMLGVFPVLDGSPTELRDEEGKLLGFEARVEARTMSGQVVGAAVARCLRDEANWKSRDEYALLSMAQTRAAAKALRLPLGFVMSLAGFDATPLEEMTKPTEVVHKTAKSKPSAKKEPELPPSERPAGKVILAKIAHAEKHRDIDDAFRLFLLATWEKETLDSLTAAEADAYHELLLSDEKIAAKVVEYGSSAFKVDKPDDSSPPF